MKKRGPYRIADIAASLKRILTEKAGVWCPHCGQQLRVQPHLVTANMVEFLRLLAGRHHAFGGGWYRTADIVPHVQARHQKRSTDGPSARYFGLIFASDDSVNAVGAPVGSYQITALGLEFLRGECSVPDRAFVINGELWRSSHDLVTVNMVKHVAFDYTRDVLGLAAQLKALNKKP